MDKLEKNLRIIKKILYLILMILFLVLMVVSILHIIFWNKSNKETNEQIEKTLEKVEVKEVDTSKKEVTKVNPDSNKTGLYWEYIKMPLIEVDFNKLKKENSDTVAWLQVKGTNVNYPVVQTKDNDYYLNHSFNKKKNDAGWVFMDYRNDKKTWHQNTIFYAHSRLDTTMFGSLKNIFKGDWLKNNDNHIIRISTEYENTMWQVFSVYKIKTTNDYLVTNFSSSDEYLNFLKMLEKEVLIILK